MNTQAAKTTDQVDDQIDDDAFEVEIVDDVPEDDKPRRAEPTSAADIPADDDLESYSESVQKRIKKLTFEAKEAARQREAAARERDEAANFAKTLTEQNKRLQEQLATGQSAVVAQAKSRVETQLAQARSAYKAAYELGDADKVLEAQMQLIELQGQLTQLSNYRPAPKAADPDVAPKAPAAQPAPQPKPTVELTPRQRQWLDANPWYGENSEMTGFALGVHERIMRSGVAADSETYYTQVDEAMRKRFADEFSGAEEVEVTPPQRKAAHVVAPAGRTPPSPRRIKLTSTQAALAKRLGLTPEQYAAQLLKDARNV
jgi:hypothetical protein